MNKIPFVVSLSNHAVGVMPGVYDNPDSAPKAWLDKFIDVVVPVETGFRGDFASAPRAWFDRLTTNGIFDRLTTNRFPDKPLRNGFFTALHNKRYWRTGSGLT